jgi:hypothetical protein
VFDGATTAGHYVGLSAGTDGDCTDAGATYPTSGQVIGRVLSTNVGAGTYSIALFPPEIAAGSGGAPSTFNLSGTYAALPAAGTAGRVYYPTDSPYTHLRDNGASWDHFRHGIQVTPPVDGSFSWVNQGGATTDATSGAVVLCAPAGAGQNCRLRVKAMPARPFTLTVGFLSAMAATQFPSNSPIAIRDSVGAKFVLLQFWTNNNSILEVGGWTNPTSGVSAQEINYTFHQTTSENWVRVVITAGAGTRTWYYSTDGVNWIRLASSNWDTWITPGVPDQIGFEVHSENANIPACMTVFHWLVT